MAVQTTISTTIDPAVHRWTRAEFRRMGEIGLFDGRHVQLIRGQVIDMSPIKSRYATGILNVMRVLGSILPNTAHLRPQLPLMLGNFSEPEPDTAIVAGSLEDFAHNHPTTALLVVEVSDSTLTFVRQTKSVLYAQAGIPEYWILNLVDNALEIYRDPQPEGYQSKNVHPASAQIAPLFAPNTVVSVSDLLP